jgi:hypothetical protein
MRRIITLVVVALVMAAVMVAMAMPAFAAKPDKPLNHGQCHKGLNSGAFEFTQDGEKLNNSELNQATPPARSSGTAVEKGNEGGGPRFICRA